MAINTYSQLHAVPPTPTLDELDGLDDMESIADTDIKEDDDCLALDTKWIDDVETYNKDYAKFYKDDVYHIRAVFIYVDHDRAITHVSEQSIDLATKNVLTQQEIASLVNDKNRVGKKKYRLVKCYLYNIDIDPEDLHTFIRDTPRVPGVGDGRFFRQIDLAHNVPIYPTISQFQSLNTTYLFMREKNPDAPLGGDGGGRVENTTRKIKRVSFHPDLKHTRRRGYSSVSTVSPSRTAQ